MRELSRSCLANVIVSFKRQICFHAGLKPVNATGYDQLIFFKLFTTSI